MRYYAQSAGDAVLIAEVKPAAGKLSAVNQVVYEDAFDGGVLADLRYTVILGGLEQAVILRRQLPGP